jgi:hypothetical protein
MLIVAAAALVLLAGVTLTVVMLTRNNRSRPDEAALLLPMPAGATACPAAGILPGSVGRCWWTTNPAATTRVEVASLDQAGGAALPGSVPLPSVPGAVTATVHGSEQALGRRGGYMFAVELADPVLATQLGDTHPRAAELQQVALAVYQRLPA